MNDKPVVIFPAYGQTLRTTNAFGVAGDSDRTLLTVQHYLVVATGTNAEGNAFGIDFAPDLKIFYLPYHWLTDNVVANQPEALARWNVDIAVHQSSLSSGRVDARSVGDANVVVLNTIPGPLTIGTRTPGDGLSRPGEVAEIWYYNRALSQAQLEQIEEYLGYKGGLQKDFPPDRSMGKKGIPYPHISQA